MKSELEECRIGICMSGVEAVEFLETLLEKIPADIKNEDFCSKYERMLNRVRYEVRKSIPVPPKIYKRKFTSYTCGQCGYGVRRDLDRHCPKCGREIKW